MERRLCAFAEGLPDPEVHPAEAGKEAEKKPTENKEVKEDDIAKMRNERTQKAQNDASRLRSVGLDPVANRAVLEHAIAMGRNQRNTLVSQDANRRLQAAGLNIYGQTPEAEANRQRLEALIAQPVIAAPNAPNAAPTGTQNIQPQQPGAGKGEGKENTTNKPAQTPALTKLEADYQAAKAKRKPEGQRTKTEQAKYDFDDALHEYKKAQNDTTKVSERLGAFMNVVLAGLAYAQMAMSKEGKEAAPAKAGAAPATKPGEKGAEKTPEAPKDAKDIDDLVPEKAKAEENQQKLSKDLVDTDKEVVRLTTKKEDLNKQIISAQNNPEGVKALTPQLTAVTTELTNAEAKAKQLKNSVETGKKRIEAMTTESTRRDKLLEDNNPSKDPALDRNAKKFWGLRLDGKTVTAVHASTADAKEIQKTVDALKKIEPPLGNVRAEGNIVKFDMTAAHWTDAKAKEVFATIAVIDGGKPPEAVTPKK
jgi:hypothetical protein